ncbi:MAG: YihY/virulence factor BrkB family protein [Nitrosomonadales bacterium]|nr:MAG: YihY/virulence factor BrkB family protein [Nitrosomonadales bacterium]
MLMRTILILVQDIVQGQLTLRAMSLVYTTLLSIVPLLALTFSVLKAFGVHNKIQPMLLTFLEPLGEEGKEVASNIVQFIENMNVGVLGAVGLGLLLYTAISLMQKIEQSLNYIWHISLPRRIGERVVRYLSVIMVGPILVFSALGITATVMNHDAMRGILAIGALDETVKILSKLMPYLLVISFFTFVYMFIPNTRVRFKPALIGGTVSGIGWQTAGWLFATFVASSNNYAAVYSGLAILILFMIWLYLSWLILLFGASVAFYIQHQEYIYFKDGQPRLSDRLSNRMRERLALSIMCLVAGKFLDGEPMPSISEFKRLLGVPIHVLQTVLDTLERQEFIVQNGDDPPAYLPARDPSLVSVTQVLNNVRIAGEDRLLSPDRLQAPRPVEEVLDRMQQAVESSVGDITLRDLVTQNTENLAQNPKMMEDW